MPQRQVLELTLFSHSLFTQKNFIDATKNLQAVVVKIASSHEIRPCDVDCFQELPSAQELIGLQRIVEKNVDDDTWFKHFRRVRALRYYFLTLALKTHRCGVKHGLDASGLLLALRL